MAEFVRVNFLPAKVVVERRGGGALALRSPEPLAPYARCIGDHLEHWAKKRPDRVFLAQRDDGRKGCWRTMTYAETRNQARAIAAALLGRGLSPSRPVVILSENSVEHALLALAALHVGIPVAPISPAYSLVSRDFNKLRAVFSLLTPGLVFVDDGTRFAPALSALSDFDFDLVVARDDARSTERVARRAESFASLLERHGRDKAEAVDRAFAAIDSDTIAKFLLTSGSTGEPKAVINTQRMLCSNQQSHAQCWPFLAEEPPVIVDWLPWNHTMAGNNNFGAALTHGGSYYIDEGRPTPGLINETVRNLREISPTVYYNVPRGYDALAPFLECDAEFRRSFFARLKVMLYGGAALPAGLWERLNRAALAELGRRVYVTAGYGATETGPGVTLVHFETSHAGALGLPIPGVELKLVPLGGHDSRGKYELRVKGPNVTPGYWKRDDLTAAAFDEEGYYRLGDAARLVDPADPAQGVEFAGRFAEDFKLSSGVWAHVGALRAHAISALAPVAQEIVVTGHDRDEIGLLIFPSLAGCRSICPDLDEQTSPDTLPAKLFADSRVRARLREGMRRLEAAGGGSSTYATRAMILAEPPSIDAGEITDKGYINQRRVLERRAALVERLYADPASADVILIAEE
jgi:feruloyl-CoA synthase